MMNICCKSSQKGTKIVAIFQIICSGIALLLVGVGLLIRGTVLVAIFAQDSPNGIIQDTISNVNFSLRFEVTENNGIELLLCHLVAYLIFFTIAGLLFIVDIELLRGSKLRNVGKCRMWLTIRCIRLTFAIVIFIVSCYKSNLELILGFALFEILLDAICIYFVKRFVSELKKEEHEDHHREKVFVEGIKV